MFDRDSQPERCALMLAVLSEPDRLRIVRLLASGPLTVTEIADSLESSLGNVSHHLKTLRRVELVDGTKRGRHVVYSLRDGVWSQTGDLLGEPSDRYDLGCCRLSFPRVVEGEVV